MIEMLNDSSIALGLAVVAAPAVLLAGLGLLSLFDRHPSEEATGRWVAWATGSGLLAALALLVVIIFRHESRLTISLGNWVSIPHYHVLVKFLFDYLSMPFVILAFVLCGTIGTFATRYLHREPGYNRFFVLYALFVLGMAITALAGTIETLFIGWELVGLSSALLVAFFHDRPAPVRNGLRVWSVYRVSDAALVVAAVVLHHLTGEGDFDALLGKAAWPGGEAALTEQQALLVGGLLLLAAAGKSALVPFSGWLPRAMEGPTPSSAVFYGALSVHLGAFLLLRLSPILELSIWLQVVVVLLGLVTAAFASLAERVQTDIKCALSYASLTQVGIIVAEIGLGFRYVALAHIIGHACLRTLQFLRAPNLLADYRTLENAIGTRLPRSAALWRAILPDEARGWLYRFALERGYLDAFLADYIARPVLRLFRWCDAFERSWTDKLSGGASRESDRVQPSTATFEEP